MASKVLRCFLLIFFIFAYCRSVFWYQQVSIIKSQHVCSRTDVGNVSCYYFEGGWFAICCVAHTFSCVGNPFSQTASVITHTINYQLLALPTKVTWINFFLQVNTVGKEFLKSTHFVVFFSFFWCRLKPKVKVKFQQVLKEEGLLDHGEPFSELNRSVPCFGEKARKRKSGVPHSPGFELTAASL